MLKIGLISDTHGCWDSRFEKHFKECDEIWHAGDIGSEVIINQLEAHCPVRAVCGNIDGRKLSLRFSDVLKFKVEEYPIRCT